MSGLFNLLRPFIYYPHCYIMVACSGEKGKKKRNGSSFYETQSDILIGDALQ